MKLEESRHECARVSWSGVHGKSAKKQALRLGTNSGVTTSILLFGTPSGASTLTTVPRLDDRQREAWAPMSEAQFHVAFGAGQFGRWLAVRLSEPGRSVRAVWLHRPGHGGSVLPTSA